MKIQRKWHFSFSPLMHPSIISCCCSVQSKPLHRKAWQESARRLSGSFGGILYLISPLLGSLLGFLLVDFTQHLFSSLPFSRIDDRISFAGGMFLQLYCFTLYINRVLFTPYLFKHQGQNIHYIEIFFWITCTASNALVSRAWNWSCLLFLGLNDRC